MSLYFLVLLILLCPTLHCQQAIVVLTPDSIYMEICMKINKNSVLEMLVFLFSPRTITENNIDLDSARKNPTSSVKRRRTTQVINITMTKVEETHLHTYCMCLHVHINTHC